MNNLDVIQVPTFSLLSSSSNNTSSGQSALPRTLNKIVRKKAYKRTTTRTSPHSASPRRSSSSKSSPPYKNRRKLRPLLYRFGTITSLGNSSTRKKSRKTSSSTDTTPLSTRPGISSVVDTADGSTSTISSTHVQLSTPNREAPNSNQFEKNIITIESDDDDDDDEVNESPITPSPIRNSPSYGRKSKRRDASLSATTLPSSSSSSSALYPKLPTETPTTYVPCTTFVPYYLETKDDSTIDTKLISKLREGPKAEVRNGKLAQVYTAGMRGQPGYVKIGWTKQEIERRISGLNSPKKDWTIYNEADITPGAQTMFRNAYLAEQLIHLELYNSRRIAVEPDQTEWFEIDMEEAHKVCRKWRNWLMLCDPYDEKQQLKKFWSERLDRMALNDPYNASEHRCLHERWSAFLNPSLRDETLYQTLFTWRTICRWWTWICKNYTIIMILIGIIIWSVYGAVSFLLCIFGVLVMWAGLSRETNGEGKTC